MASPWVSPHHNVDRSTEPPRISLALLAAVPILSLILIRLFWSGSSLWFLTVGIILLGAAAVVFLARRSQEQDYDRRGQQEMGRLPIVLTGLGVLFLAMLILPNFAGGSDTAPVSELQQPAGEADTGVAGVSEPPVEAPADAVPPEDGVAPPAADGQLYTIQSGDTLWDIAQQYGVSVDAIVAANELANPEDLTVGEQIVIPAGGEAVP